MSKPEKLKKKAVSTGRYHVRVLKNKPVDLSVNEIVSLGCLIDMLSWRSGESLEIVF